MAQYAEAQGTLSRRHNRTFWESRFPVPALPAVPESKASAEIIGKIAGGDASAAGDLAAHLKKVGAKVRLLQALSFQPSCFLHLPYPLHLLDAVLRLQARRSLRHVGFLSALHPFPTGLRRNRCPEGRHRGQGQCQRPSGRARCLCCDLRAGWHPCGALPCLPAVLRAGAVW